MGDVFILGAGFSKAISPVMPTLFDLAHRVRRWCQANRVTVGDSIFGDNLELWLTYLSQNHPWLSEADNLRNQAQFLELSRATGAVIDECLREATSTLCPEWLWRLRYWWGLHRAAVLTLNYDTLVERAEPPTDPLGDTLWPPDYTPSPLPLDDWEPLSPLGIMPAPVNLARIQIPDLDKAPQQARFRLFKLHGSINWFYSGPSPFIGAPVYLVEPAGWRHYAAVDPQRRTAWTDYERAQAEWASIKIPLIVPPVAEKHPFFQHEVIRRVWTDAASALRSAKRIFCLGYSLPESDLTMRFLLHSSRPEGRVKFYVVNRDTGVVGRYRALLPAECYDLDEQYVGLDSIPRLVGALTQENSRGEG